MKLLIILLLTSFCSPAIAEDLRSIKVTAMSEVKVAPDEVILQLDVNTRDVELMSAKEANDKIAAAIFALSPKYSIPENDVKLIGLDVSPDYGKFSRKLNAAAAYDYTRSIEVRLTDFGKIEPFLADAFAAGLSQVSGLQFRVSNQRHHQFEARKLAVTYAREKADHLTELTGMTLGMPIRIEEDVEYNWEASGFGGAIGELESRDKAGEIVSKQPSLTFVSFQKEPEKNLEVLSAPGQIIISAQVTIEYEMSK